MSSSLLDGYSFSALKLSFCFREGNTYFGDFFWREIGRHQIGNAALNFHPIFARHGRHCFKHLLRSHQLLLCHKTPPWTSLSPDRALVLKYSTLPLQKKIRNCLKRRGVL